MKTIEIAKHKLVVYDSIEDMPIERFHRLNRYLLIDSGIGSNVSDVDNRLARAVAFLKAEDKASAIQELENMRQCIHFVASNVSPQSLAMAAMVKSIDGVEMTDITDEGLKQVMERLPELTVKELTQLVGEVKKKINDELALYFPSIFDDTSSKEYYAMLKKRALLQLQQILEDIDNIEKLAKCSLDIITFGKPKNFIGSSGSEVTYDKQYEQMCISISSELHMDAKKMTVKEYYSAYEVLVERQKAMEKARKK